LSEAVQKQTELEAAMNKPQPLKIMYRAQLVERLQAVGIEGVKAVLDEHDGTLQSQ
jgi:hypothetical protein